MAEHDDVMFPSHEPLGRRMWAIDRGALSVLADAQRSGRFLDRLAAGERPAPVAARRQRGTRAGGAVAVIPLTGLITPRGSFWDLLFGGGGGLIAFREAFRQAINDPDVGSVVLDIDSPGGLVDLVPETAAEIRDARGTKPIVAVANTMAASAAYFIASQADEVIATPSGSAGSIGVYMLHTDWSAANEKVGISPTYVFAGRYKVEGNPNEPLSDDAFDSWQEEVDDLYAMFVQAVASGRGVSDAEVRNGFGEGRTLLAGRALNAGLIDRVATLESVVDELLIPAAGGSASAAAGLLTVTEPRSAVAPRAAAEPVAEAADEDLEAEADEAAHADDVEAEPEAEATEADGDTVDEPDDEPVEDELEEEDEDDPSATATAMRAVLDALTA